MLSLAACTPLLSQKYLKPSIKRLLVCVAVLVAFTGSSLAQGLARVGPTDKANGFPQWYQDKDGVALDLCLPDQAELANGACVIFADSIPNPSAPIVFPSNFPDESFWFLANANLTVPGGRAVLVMALEAAFSADVAAGNQITFARLRILFDTAEAGHYRVTTPYGVREFDVEAPGKRSVFSTEDVGIGAPGDFSGALNCSIGPFLHASSTAGGTPSAPFLFDGNQYLSDPGGTTAVTGSPLGAAFNVFRIEGPITAANQAAPPIFETDQFTLNGRIHTASIPSPVHVVRATYGRGPDGLGHIDAFAVGIAGIGNPTPTLRLSGPAMTATDMTRTGDSFYGQAVFDQGRPNVITVTNTADAPPTPMNFPVSDEISITEATYDPASSGGTLHISANSSDHKTPPTLLYDGKQLTAGPEQWMGSITLTGVGAAPATVTVGSTYSGRTTVPVVVMQGNGQPPAPGSVPTAVSDSANTAGVAPVIIPILANDNPNTSVTPRLISIPAHGTAELLGDGTVRYTAEVGFVGDDSFQYVITLSDVDSNAASVTVTVIAANNAPIARNDSAIAVARSTAISIKVLANDSDPDAGDLIDPASIILTTLPTGGSAAVDGLGNVLYTPPTTAGTFSFTYTVTDSHTPVARSQAATVTVTVTASEAITVTKANYKANGSEWDLTGTSTILGPGNRMMIDLMRAGVKIATVGSADVDNLGAWRLKNKASAALARAGDTLRVTSSQNTVVNNVAIRIN